MALRSSAAVVLALLVAFHQWSAQADPPAEEPAVDTSVIEGFHHHGRVQSGDFGLLGTTCSVVRCESMPRPPDLRPEQENCGVDSSPYPKMLYFPEYEARVRQESGLPRARVRFLVIPRHRYFDSEGNLQTRVHDTVTVIQDPDTGRITDYYVARLVNGQSSGQQERYSDPRLNLTPPLDEWPEADRAAIEADGEQYDFGERGLLNLIGRAHAEGCEVIDEHVRAMTEYHDPGHRPVRDFFSSCGSGENFPCCGGTSGLARDCLPPGSPVSPDAAGNLQSIEDVQNHSNKQFNLELINTVREGLVKSQAEVLAVSDSTLNDYAMGPQPHRQSCGEEINAELDATVELQRQDILNPDLAEERRNLAAFMDHQLIKDAAAYAYENCVLQVTGAIGGNELVERSMNRIRTENPVLRGLSHDQILSLFGSARGALRAKGFEFGGFERRGSERHCAMPDGRESAGGTLQRIRTELAPGSPLFQELFREGDSPALRLAVQRARRQALDRFRRDLGKYSKKCDKASQRFDPNWIMEDDGLDLWRDSRVVERVVRKYALSKPPRTDELQRFRYLYCEARGRFEDHQQTKTWVMLGASAALSVLPFVGEYASVGALTWAIRGIAAVETVGAAAMAIKELRASHAEIDDASIRFHAGLADLEDVSSARRDFVSTFLQSAASTGLFVGMSSRQILGMGRAMRDFARRARAGDSILSDLARRLREGRFNRRALENAKALCESGQCDEAVEYLEAEARRMDAPPPATTSPPPAPPRAAASSVPRAPRESFTGPVSESGTRVTARRPDGGSGTGASRGYINEVDVPASTFERGDLPEAIGGFPEFADRFGFSLSNGGRTLHYPDTRAINRRLDEAASSGRDPGFRYLEVDGEIDTLEFARNWADGRLPISRNGAHHFHDLGVHWAYLALPQRVTRSSQKAMGFLHTLATDSRFAGTALQTEARATLRAQVETMDRVSADIAGHLNHIRAGVPGAEERLAFSLRQYPVYEGEPDRLFFGLGDTMSGSGPFATPLTGSQRRRLNSLYDETFGSTLETRRTHSIDKTDADMAVIRDEVYDNLGYTPPAGTVP